MVDDFKRDPAACREFQERLQVLLQSGEDPYGDPHLQHDPHLRGCGPCRALVVDLEQIADAARRRFDPNY